MNSCQSGYSCIVTPSIAIDPNIVVPAILGLIAIIVICFTIYAIKTHKGE